MQYTNKFQEGGNKIHPSKNSSMALNVGGGSSARNSVNRLSSLGSSAKTSGRGDSRSIEKARADEGAKHQGKR